MATPQRPLPTPRLDPVVRGEGPALLLAHGAGGGIEGNFGLVMDDLSGDHTLIGPHYPGAGGTPVDAEPLQLDELADQLVSSAVAAGHDSFVIIGESLGTAVAVRAAARHPERVRALVLTSGFAIADNSLTLATQLIRILKTTGNHRAAARVALQSCLSNAQLAQLPPEQLEFLIDATEQGLPPGALDHFDLVERVDVRDDLAGLSMPVLVVSPTGDRMVLPESSHRLAAAIKNAQLLELPDAGHILDEPNRAEWLAHLRTFLAALPA
jgi:pimeloyl-ACP methyl ester carboxylesterase